MKKDYRLEIKVKNNLLYSAIKNAGFESAAAFARFACIHHNEVYQWLSFTFPLYTRFGVVRKSIQRIATALDIAPQLLVPKDRWYSPIEKNTASAELTAEQLAGFLCGENKTISGQIENAELRALIVKQIRKLPDKEQAAIIGRYFQEETLEEIGTRLGVTRERVRQLEHRALRLLRHPSKSRELKPYIRGNDEN